jgi:hypothetical protein
MKKFLPFVHVPKTGGLSLMNYAEENKIISCSAKHETAKSLLMHKHDHFGLSTMIRDPFQLYISFYLYSVREKVNLYSNKTPFDEENMNLIWGENHKEKIKNNLKMNKDCVPHLTLENFLYLCSSNQMYSYFFSGVECDKFFYIGNTDKMDDSITMFNYFFNIKNPTKEILYLNINPIKNTWQKYEIKNFNVNHFNKKNEKDIYIYNEFKNKHEKEYKRIGKFYA